MDDELRAFLEDRFARLEQRMGALEELIGSLDGRLARVEPQVTTVGERVVGVESAVAAVGERVTRVESAVAAVGERVTGVESAVAAVGERVTGVESQVTALRSQTSDLGVLLESTQYQVRLVAEGHSVLYGAIDRQYEEVRAELRDVRALLRVWNDLVTRRLTDLEYRVREKVG
ncbi:MAG: hypothetical protein AB1446_04520 [Bacillota bacterium]